MTSEINESIMENVTSGNQSQQSVEEQLNKIVYSAWSPDIFKDAVKRLLESGYDGLQSDTAGNTVLNYAVQHGYADVVKILVKHFVNVDDNVKIFPVPGNIEKISENDIFEDSKSADSLLIKMLNKLDMNKTTPLYYAVERKDFDIACTLAQHGANINSVSSDIKKELLLHCQLKIIVYNSWSHDYFKDSVNKLLEFGYDGSQTDGGGNTALAYAVKHGYPDIVRNLMSHYSDIDVNETIFSAPLHIEQKIGSSVFEESKFMDSRLIKMVNKEDIDGKPPLYYAVERKDYDVACILIRHGADINSLTKENQKELLLHAAKVTHAAHAKEHEFRPVVGLLAISVPDAVLEFSLESEYPRLLSYFLMHGHIKVVDALLKAVGNDEKRKAILNCEDDGVTPLDRVNATVGKGLSDDDHLKLVKYLRESGATKTCGDARPIHMTLQSASLLGDLKTFEQFAGRGDKKDFSSYINVAIANNHLNVVQYIWKNYCKYTTDNSGNTALHYAASQGELPIIKYLCENGANLNKANLKNETPLHSAFEKQRAEVFEYLSDEGAHCICGANHTL